MIRVELRTCVSDQILIIEFKTPEYGFPSTNAKCIRLIEEQFAFLIAHINHVVTNKSGKQSINSAATLFMTKDVLGIFCLDYYI